jgi:hypothetical protein
MTAILHIANVALIALQFGIRIVRGIVRTIERLA